MRRPLPPILLLALALSACADGPAVTSDPAQHPRVSPLTKAMPELPSHKTSSDSRSFLLTLRHITRLRSNRESANASGFALRADFDFHPAPNSPFSPADNFLNQLTVCQFLPASSENKAIVIPNPGWTNNRPCTLTLDDIPIARDATTLPPLQVTVETVVVTKWKTLIFDHLTVDQAPLHCGPFELSLRGNETRCHVSAAARSEFQSEHDAFAKSHPHLSFFHQRFAADTLQLTDALGRILPHSLLVTSGSTSTASFVPSGGLQPIAYPLRLTLRVPETVTTAEEIFTIRDLPIPAPASPTQDFK